ncbi:alpha/beta hydrolase [Actinomadura flavalba]|uniref:alpha/beta hydrolase n=1 Tax=Actinomadura flavalba TaxID=1120938 RepID=UPI0003809B72|nr:alpha/beta hydrolase [Actinomadura flavalba]
MLTLAGKGALAGAAALAVLAAGLAPAAAAPSITWRACPDTDPVEGTALKGLECGDLKVPLDHANPGGPTVTLALTRAKHTARRSQGVVLLNRGGPGAHGRDLAGGFQRGMPDDVGAAYDWIGFDPRGVGASRPALTCDTSYQEPGRPRADTVPADAAAEEAWKERAKRFADDCGRRYGRLLPHMGTAAWIEDMEAIRRALDADRLNYFGYSYGTYLGAAYATRYPHRVRRMVLDSVVRPTGVWYPSQLDQNVAFEHRIRAYFDWIARNDARYRLGTSRAAVQRSYDRARAKLAKTPIDKRIGASELDDVFLGDGYGTRTWPAHAKALADYLRRRDPAGLRAAWQKPDAVEQNTFTMYNAVQCRDAVWPRDWSRWHRDATRQWRAGYRFETWGNVWYNAPCAFWSVPGGTPPEVGGVAAPLLIQATEDAATPYAGAVETHGRFPASRLVVQRGGGDHGVTFGGDACVDGAVAAYLRDGTMPESRPGPDTTCTAPPPPTARQAASPLADAASP